MHLILFALLFAQKPDVDFIPSRPFPPKAFSVPFRVTASYGMGRSSFMPRFMYDTEPQLIETRFQTITINARANRWEAVGVFDLGASFQHNSATSLTVRGVPIAVGGGRLTASARYDSSSNQYELFRGQDSQIAGHNDHRSLMGRVDLAIYHSEATWLGATGFYGNTWEVDRTTLTVGQKTIRSPLDLALATRSAYSGTGIDGGIRVKTVAFNGSAFMYMTQARRKTLALPGDCAELSGRLTYMIRKRAGVFVGGTWVLGFGRNRFSTIPMFNNRITAGLATRLP